MAENIGLKQIIQNIWSMTVIRIATDSDNIPFVEVRIDQTGQEKRLYAGDNLEMHLDLDKLSQ